MASDLGVHHRPARLALRVSGRDCPHRSAAKEPQEARCHQAYPKVEHPPAESSPHAHPAGSTAALLTAAAYGPVSEWAFVAPSDCGLGCFARTWLRGGQVVGEYGGPRLRDARATAGAGSFLLQVHTHGTHAAHAPRTHCARTT